MTQARGRHVLFVDESRDSTEAERLLRDLPDIHLELRHSRGSTFERFPYLIAPEGSFQSLRGVQEYVNAFRAQLELLRKENLQGQTEEAVWSFFRAELSARLASAKGA